MSTQTRDGWYAKDYDVFMNRLSLTETLIMWHGEQYRYLITHALRWLQASEPSWGLRDAMDPMEFIDAIVKAAERSSEMGKYE